MRHCNQPCGWLRLMRRRAFPEGRHVAACDVEPSRVNLSNDCPPVVPTLREELPDPHNANRGGAMAAKTPILASSGSCPRCNSTYGGCDERCPTCKYDLGSPNVREHGSLESQKALSFRADQAPQVGSSRIKEMLAGMPESLRCDSTSIRCSGCHASGCCQKSRVRSPCDLRKLRDACPSRSPASIITSPQQTSCGRRGGILFGTYGQRIIYGALSTRKVCRRTVASAATFVLSLFKVAHRS